MANTPNMNLVLSVVGVSTGLEWEQNLNIDLNIIDQHNHTPGYGAAITPAAFNINDDLNFNGNNAIGLKSARFNVQISPLAGVSDLGCIYVSGVDLYYNDVNGNQVRITSGGSVNATSSGISSGTATASFVSGVLVVNVAANTPANIQAGSILIGNNLLNSKFLTLAPPAAMGSNFSLTLPNIPVSKKIVTLDTSGNLVADYVTDNSTLEVSANTLRVKDLGISTAKIAANAVGWSQIATSVLKITQYTSSSGTFTTQADTTKILVLGRAGSGGGGGGGGDTAGGSGAGGGGGGGGCVTISQVLTVTGSTGYAYVIGAGGAGGTGSFNANGTAGTAGTDTTLGSILTLKGASGGSGGTKGSAAQDNPGGSGGPGRVATGGAGGTGSVGGGGGGAGSGGVNSPQADAGAGGAGDGVAGGGGGGGGGAGDGAGGAGSPGNSGTGAVGTSGGGGGGGGGAGDGSAGGGRTGGAGTDGYLTIIEFR